MKKFRKKYEQQKNKSYFVLIFKHFFKTKSKKEQKTEKCKKRKYCKNMSSCEEAKFYLEVCKHTNLDKDGDGIPCENVCK